jgi:hypothetical protein
VLSTLPATEVERVPSGGCQILVNRLDYRCDETGRPGASDAPAQPFAAVPILLNRNLTDVGGFASTIAPLNELGKAQIAEAAGKRPSTLAVDRSETPNGPRLRASGRRTIWRFFCIPEIPRRR